MNGEAGHTGSAAERIHHHQFVADADRGLEATTFLKVFAVQHGAAGIERDQC